MLWSGCGSPGRLVPHGDFVEVLPREGFLIRPEDYLAAGQAQLSTYLGNVAEKEREPVLELIRRLGRRCVRIELAYDSRSSEYAADLGSGILLGAGPFVLTAEHVVSTDPRIPLRVVLPDGRSYTAHWVTSGAAKAARPRGDWALLELSGYEDSIPAMEVGSLPRGELGILLGFPSGSLGLDPEGEAGYGPGHGQSARSLTPIAVILRGRSESGLWFEPVAGVLPMAGMSGGPIVDLQGRLVAVLSQTRTSLERTGVRYEIGGGPASTAASHATPGEEVEP